MPDVTIAYKNSTITSLSSSGAVALSTAGKYLEDDLTITYTTPLPNLSSISIKPENCASSSTQITPETYICETDSNYPGTVISMNNQTYCNIGGYLNNNIKIELNKTYHCVGQLFIKWDDDDTEEYYYIDSDFTTGSSYTTFLLNFTWEGNSGATQTFGYMYLEITQGYKTRMRPSRSGSITKSGVLLPGSFYRIIQPEIEGYGTINLDFNNDPRFYEIYQSLAYRSTIASSAPYVSEWCNSLSSIYSFQFAGQSLSGGFIFSNVSFVGQYAFAWNYTGGFTGGATAYNLTFPILSRFNDNSPFAMNRGLTSIYCPSVTTIGSYIFQSCYSLTSAIFPECTSIGNSAFYGCNKLTTISFPECTTIGNAAFQNCSSLTTISFPECITISSNAFYNCSKLSSIYFPKCTIISNNAFYSCSSLVTISFPECTSIGNNTFQNCSNLTTISFPKCTSISNYAFNSCSKLISVSFSECTFIGSSVFYNCQSLTIAIFPKCTTIQTGAFSNCYSLSDISFPQCNSIMNMAFYSCSALTMVSFPNCTYLSTYVFRFCRNLSSFYFMGSSIPSIQNTTFTNTTVGDSTYLGYFGSIYVPSSLLASYKTATNWATYSARMVGI